MGRTLRHLLLIATAGSACALFAWACVVSPTPLDHLPCNCVSGYECDPDTSTCRVACKPVQTATGPLATHHCGSDDCVRFDSPQHCGSCDNNCDAEMGGLGQCVTDAQGIHCAPLLCPAGFVNGKLVDGYVGCDAISPCVPLDNAVQCGSCSNACYSLQVFGCNAGVCECNPNLGKNNFQCGGTGTCNADSNMIHVCNCGGQTCMPGETCKTSTTCGCGPQKCNPGQICCGDLKCHDWVSPTDCGACGRACPTDYICTAHGGKPFCGCDPKADHCADFPSDGACDGATGLCTCGGKKCDMEKRCVIDPKTGKSACET